MEAESPIPRCFDVLSGPLTSVTLWGKSSWFVHVTVLPAFTSITAGANLYDLGRFTLSVGTGSPFTLNGASLLALELLDEQPTSPSRAVAASAARRREVIARPRPRRDWPARRPTTPSGAARPRQTATRRP